MPHPSRPSTRRTAAVALALATVLSACGGGGGDVEGAPNAPSAGTTPPSTAAPAAPLTGLTTTDPALLGRPALVVKIDNHPKAWPQVGLDVADVVYEEVVEGGATRFAAVFHSTDSDPVGPVRSARTTDIELLTSLNRPLFAWAGANAGVERQIEEAPLVDVGWRARPGDYRRLPGRPAPSNLFTDTTALRSAGDAEGGAAAPLFAYRPPGTAPVGGEAVAAVTVRYGGPVDVTVEWRWDPALGGWVRTQGGVRHTVESGTPIAPENVVIQFVEYVDTGFVDVTGAASPVAELVGEGEAWVLTGGQLVRGRWSRPDAGSATSFVDAAGAPIGLTPGRTWVALPRPGGAEVGG